MPTKKEEQLIVQAQAALDQLWPSLEILMEWIQKFGEHGISEHPTEEEREICRLCCQLVSWEMTMRVLGRDQVLKCDIVDEQENECRVAINTIKGQVMFYVDKHEIVDCGDGKGLRIKAHRVIDNNYCVFADGEYRVVVPESEIVEE